MGRPRHQLTTLFAGAAFAALLAVPSASAAVLLYKGTNKWVSPEDNKPLQTLLKAARSGKTIYTVKLPTDNRSLAITRLEILSGLLAREAKSPVVMEEASGSSPPNTLEVK